MQDISLATLISFLSHMLSLTVSSTMLSLIVSSTHAIHSSCPNPTSLSICLAAPPSHSLASNTTHVIHHWSYHHSFPLNSHRAWAWDRSKVTITEAGLACTGGILKLHSPTLHYATDPRAWRFIEYKVH